MGPLVAPHSHAWPPPQALVHRARLCAAGDEGGAALGDTGQLASAHGAHGMQAPIGAAFRIKSIKMKKDTDDQTRDGGASANSLNRVLLHLYIDNFSSKGQTRQCTTVQKSD